MKLSERITISMLNGVTMKINIDEYLLNTLKEDITSEDVSTNAVMPDDKQGKADLICKQNGVICGLDVGRYLRRCKGYSFRRKNRT